MNRHLRKKSNLRFDAAGADETPAADGLKNREQTGDHENQAQPPLRGVLQDDAGNQTDRAGYAARNAAIAFKVGPEELVHGGNLAQSFSVASGA
jgi:hypothetical protein